MSHIKKEYIDLGVWAIRMNWPNLVTQSELSESVKTYQAQSHSKTCWTIISKPLESALLENCNIGMEDSVTGEFKLHSHQSLIQLLDSANDVPTS